jgi:hypothetical protein
MPTFVPVESPDDPPLLAVLVLVCDVCVDAVTVDVAVDCLRVELVAPVAEDGKIQPFIWTPYAMEVVWTVEVDVVHKGDMYVAN